MIDVITDITEAEQQEYLAYKSPQDFFCNLASGIREIERYSFEDYKGKAVLVCGGMIGFDRGLSEFLNSWSCKEKNLFLLSEVTAQYRRYTKERIKFPFICTPHLLAKEIFLIGMPIQVTEDMIKLSKEKAYVKEAILNMEGKYRGLGKGYAMAWSYYAYQYIIKLLEKLQPQKVVLWNEFYAFHHIFQGICIERQIPIEYIEFGCIPGTICIEAGGQQGESLVSVQYNDFQEKEVTSKEIAEAKKVLRYLKKTGMNRNPQPEIKLTKNMLISWKSGRKTILYMGQNDYESGMYPYSCKTEKFHSPVFQSTLEGLEYLNLLAIEQGWNLIFKPHPIILSLEYEEYNRIQDINMVTEVNLNKLIDKVDLVITILSQGAYVSLIRKKPVLMLGYTQLRGKQCTYEAFHKSEIKEKIQEALRYGYTRVQKRMFQKHTAQLLKYYLYDDGTPRNLRWGKSL